MQAPGLPTGIVFGNLTPQGFPAMNSSGQAAFWALLLPKGSVRPTAYAPLPPGMTDSIWLATGDALTLIARMGDQAPGAPPGAVFGRLESHYTVITSPVINDAGQVAFSAKLQNGSGGVTNSNNFGIWLHSGGETKLIARTGTQSPGMPAGTVFHSFGLPLLNGRGETLVNARLAKIDGSETNTRLHGVWISEPNGDLRLVAGPGDQAPGMPLGDTFVEVGGDAAINAAGQVLLTANTRSGAYGAWVADRNGRLQLILREGDLIDVDDGPGVSLRQLSSYRFYSRSGNDDGRPSGFNDLGQLAFHATFTDGSSGIFVSNLAAIPEPTSCVLCWTGLILLATAFPRRRR